MAVVAAGEWTANPLQLIPLAIIAIAYARRAHTLRRRGRPVAHLRQASFYAGIAVVMLAVASPIDTLGEQRLFWVHMTQHLLLGDIAPLLIVLGVDGQLLRPLLAIPLIQRLRVFAHPLVALPLWAASLYLWHVPALYQAALAHDLVHALQHESFLAFGALMWAAVVEPLPGPEWFGSAWKAAYVLAVRTAGAALGSVLIWSGSAFYPHYAAGERLERISPSTDQTIGGALMFVEGSIVTLIVFAWLFVRWTREAELRQTLLDRGYGQREAARAARYGRRAISRSGEGATG